MVDGVDKLKAKLEQLNKEFDKIDAERHALLTFGFYETAKLEELTTMWDNLDSAIKEFRILYEIALEDQKKDAMGLHEWLTL